MLHLFVMAARIFYTVVLAQVFNICASMSTILEPMNKCAVCVGCAMPTIIMDKLYHEMSIDAQFYSGVNDKQGVRATICNCHNRANGSSWCQISGL